MPAYPSPFDGPEMDVLVAQCERHALNPCALFQTELHRMPTMWRDGKRAWWVVLLPGGRQQILTVNTGNAVRHQLGVGVLARAAVAGASAFRMMEVSRHRSMETVRGYVRDAELFRDHAGSAFLQARASLSGEAPP